MTDNNDGVAVAEEDDDASKINYNKKLSLIDACAKLKDNDKHMIQLDLSETNVGDAGAVALAFALKKNTTLKELHLGKTNIGVSGITKLAYCLRHSNYTLERLYLQDNPLIGDKGVEVLASIFQPPPPAKTTTIIPNEEENIQKLNDDSISSKHHEIIKTRKCNIRLLNLARCNIGDIGVSALAENLSLVDDDEHYASLFTKLYLYGNSVGNIGASAIAEMIIMNYYIQELFIWDNKNITTSGIEDLEKAYTMQTRTNGIKLQLKLHWNSTVIASTTTTKKYQNVSDEIVKSKDGVTIKRLPHLMKKEVEETIDPKVTALKTITSNNTSKMRDMFTQSASNLNWNYNMDDDNDDDNKKELPNVLKNSTYYAATSIVTTSPKRETNKPTIMKTSSIKHLLTNLEQSSSTNTNTTQKSWQKNTKNNDKQSTSPKTMTQQKKISKEKLEAFVNNNTKTTTIRTTTPQNVKYGSKSSHGEKSTTSTSTIPKVLMSPTNNKSTTQKMKTEKFGAAVNNDNTETTTTWGRNTTKPQKLVSGSKSSHGETSTTTTSSTISKELMSPNNDKSIPTNTTSNSQQLDVMNTSPEESKKKLSNNPAFERLRQQMELTGGISDQKSNNNNDIVKHRTTATTMKQSHLINNPFITTPKHFVISPKSDNNNNKTKNETFKELRQSIPSTTKSGTTASLLVSLDDDSDHDDNDHLNKSNDSKSSECHTSFASAHSVKISDDLSKLPVNTLLQNDNKHREQHDDPKNASLSLLELLDDKDDDINVAAATSIDDNDETILPSIARNDTSNQNSVRNLVSAFQTSFRNNYINDHTISSNLDKEITMKNRVTDSFDSKSSIKDPRSNITSQGVQDKSMPSLLGSSSERGNNRSASGSFVMNSSSERSPRRASSTIQKLQESFNSLEKPSSETTSATMTSTSERRRRGGSIRAIQENFLFNSSATKLISNTILDDESNHSPVRNVKRFLDAQKPETDIIPTTQSLPINEIKNLDIHSSVTKTVLQEHSSVVAHSLPKLNPLDVQEATKFENTLKQESKRSPRIISNATTNIVADNPIDGDHGSTESRDFDICQLGSERTASPERMVESLPYVNSTNIIESTDADFDDALLGFLDDSSGDDVSVYQERRSTLFASVYEKDFNIQEVRSLIQEREDIRKLSSSNHSTMKPSVYSDGIDNTDHSASLSQSNASCTFDDLLGTVTQSDDESVSNKQKIISPDSKMKKMDGALVLGHEERSRPPENVDAIRTEKLYPGQGISAEGTESLLTFTYSNKSTSPKLSANVNAKESSPNRSASLTNNRSTALSKTKMDVPVCENLEIGGTSEEPVKNRSSRRMSLPMVQQGIPSLTTNTKFMGAMLGAIDGSERGDGSDRLTMSERGSSVRGSRGLISGTNVAGLEQLKAMALELSERGSNVDGSTRLRFRVQVKKSKRRPSLDTKAESLEMKADNVANLLKSKRSSSTSPPRQPVRNQAFNSPIKTSRTISAHNVGMANNKMSAIDSATMEKTLTGTATHMVCIEDSNTLDVMQLMPSNTHEDRTQSNEETTTDDKVTSHRSVSTEQATSRVGISIPQIKDSEDKKLPNDEGNKQNDSKSTKATDVARPSTNSKNASQQENRGESSGTEEAKNDAISYHKVRKPSRLATKQSSAKDPWEDGGTDRKEIFSQLKQKAMNFEVKSSPARKSRRQSNVSNEKNKELLAQLKSKEKSKVLSTTTTKVKADASSTLPGNVADEKKDLEKKKAVKKENNDNPTTVTTHASTTEEKSKVLSTTTTKLKADATSKLPRNVADEKKEKDNKPISATSHPLTTKEKSKTLSTTTKRLNADASSKLRRNVADEKKETEKKENDNNPISVTTRASTTKEKSKVSSTTTTKLKADASSKLLRNVADEKKEIDMKGTDNNTSSVTTHATTTVDMKQSPGRFNLDKKISNNEVTPKSNFISSAPRTDDVQERKKSPISSTRKDPIITSPDNLVNIEGR